MFLYWDAWVKQAISALKQLISKGCFKEFEQLCVEYNLQ